MFEIVFLGTSASAPSIRRNLPAMVLRHEEFRFLIDCGEGTQRQLLQSGIGFKRLNRILVTHGHLDHILGLGGLLSTFMRWETIDWLEIYGGKNTLERISDLLFGVVLRGNKSPMPIKLVQLDGGIFFDAEDLTVEAFPVSHRATHSLGYIFQEKGKHPFLAEKAEALAIPQGPWRRDLVAGKRVTLPDGRVIEPEEVLGEFKPGTRVVVVGDTGSTKEIEPFVQGADCLIIEATYLEEEADLAREFAHLTARQSAELARVAGVKQLILTHISRRYREKDLQAEAEAVFPNVTIARDFDTFQIKRD